MSDILLSDDGKFPLQPKIDNGVDITIQRIEAAIGLFQGEWRLDSAEGLPWLRWLRSSPPPLPEISAVVRAEIDDVLGVESVPSMEVGFENAVITIDAEARLQDDTRVQLTTEVDTQAEEFHPLFTTNILEH